MAGCAAAEGPQQISDSGIGAFEPSLAPTEDGFVVAWYDVRDGNPEIYFRLLTAAGRPTRGEYRLTNDAAASYEPDVTAVGANIAVAWYDKADDGRMQARLGLWARDGTRLWSRALSSPDRSARNPTMAALGTELFVAWLEDTGTDASDVWAGWWNLGGEPIAAPRRIATAGRTTWNLNAALDPLSGQAWLVFDAMAGTQADELFLSRVDRESSTTRRLSHDDGVPSKYPDIALSGTHAALTWYDERDGNEEVYLFVGPTSGPPAADAPGTIDTAARRVTSTSGSSIGAYLAWNGATLGLAWSDDTEGQHEIYFQRFGIDGAPLAAARRVTTNGTSSLVPAIRPAGTGFALAWNEYAPPADDADHGSTGRSEIAFTVVP